MISRLDCRFCSKKCGVTRRRIFSSDIGAVTGRGGPRDKGIVRIKGGADSSFPITGSTLGHELLDRRFDAPP
jgi:hypothetical protein